MRLSRRALLCWVAGAVAVGCLSPTLPLPPPSEPDVRAVGQGQYRIQGGIPLPGTVFVLNSRTKLVFGQIADHQAYDFLVEAQQNDSMLLWYESGLDQSEPVEFTVEAEQLDGGVGADAHD